MNYCSGWGIILEYGNVVVNLGAVFLGDTFTDPHNVPAFLLFQLEISIENSKMKLLQECVDVESYLEQDILNEHNNTHKQLWCVYNLSTNY